MTTIIRLCEWSHNDHRYCFSSLWFCVIKKRWSNAVSSECWSRFEHVSICVCLKWKTNLSFFSPWFGYDEACLAMHFAPYQNRLFYIQCRCWHSRRQHDCLCALYFIWWWAEWKWYNNTKGFTEFCAIKSMAPLFIRISSYRHFKAIGLLMKSLLYAPK